jgi:hypothetical protein
VIDINYSDLKEYSPLLHSLVLDCFAKVKDGNYRLLNFGNRTTGTSQSPLKYDDLTTGIQTWHANLEARLSQRLISKANIYIGNWNLGSYSIRCNESLNIYCGSYEGLHHIMKHEILHYYLRRLLPLQLVDTDYEERFVQYETCWYENITSFEEWHTRLQRISYEFNRNPFSKRDFTLALEYPA